MAPSNPPVSGNGLQNRAARDAHVPVLLNDVIAGFGPLTNKVIFDGTFGAGGYSRALLSLGARVIGCDRDPDAYAIAKELAAQNDRFQAVHGRFSDLVQHIADCGHERVDGVVLDIGVSSMQLDQAGRGFSFRHDGPLDMRMAQSGLSARDVVNEASEAELSNILFAYGEERRARAIARAIIAARDEAPIETTGTLAKLIETVLGRRQGEIHPATRSFQALRIYVNRELEELVEALFGAEEILPVDGVLCVVSFHSLEDRIVKRFFASAKGGGGGSRHAPMQSQSAAQFNPVAKPVRASEAEINQNPRARSAMLRVGRRASGAARPMTMQGLGLPNSLNKNSFGEGRKS